MTDLDPGQARWSTRYYRLDCDDIRHLIKTNGPDDRDDPPADATLPCVADRHGQHALVRISPAEFERLDGSEW